MATPKSSSKLLYSALLKNFKANAGEEVHATSELSSPLKILNKRHGSTPTSPSSSSAPTGSPPKPFYGLADKFVMQLKSTSAKNSEKSTAIDQESCAEVARAISSIIPSSNDRDSATLQFSFAQAYRKENQDVVDQRKKETSRFRKQKVVQKNVKSRHFAKLMNICAEKLDVQSTLGVLNTMGRQISSKEYTTLITFWIEKARKNNDEDSLCCIQNVFHLFACMKERGFQILEDCYGPLFEYMIDMGLKEEFHNVTKFIKDYDHESYTKIGYYEMLFCIKTGDKCRIMELCNSIVTDCSDSNNKLAESYLLALCENDLEAELILLLEAFDMSKISSLALASCISKSTGRLKLEDFIEKLIMAFKVRGTDEENISSLVYDYASSIPNLAVRNFS